MLQTMGVHMTYAQMIERIGTGVRPITAARTIFGKPKPSWACDLRNYCWNRLTACNYPDATEYNLISERIYSRMPQEVRAIADTLTYQ